MSAAGAGPRPTSEDPFSAPAAGGEGPLGGFAETTSRIVRQAASILEEEIAAGVVAAKQVEQRFIDVDTLRTGDPGEVIQRFRRDTHEVVDIILDLAHAASRSVGDVAGRAVRLRPAGMAPRSRTAETLMGGASTPTLTLPEPLEPGGSSEVVMNVENDSDAPTAAFEFHTTDLVDQEGNRIPADRVTFSSDALTVGPHETGKVSIRVTVPEGTPAGIYSGLLQASRLENLRAILVIKIT